MSTREAKLPDVERRVAFVFVARASRAIDRGGKARGRPRHVLVFAAELLKQHTLRPFVVAMVVRTSSIRSKIQHKFAPIRDIVRTSCRMSLIVIESGSLRG